MNFKGVPDRALAEHCPDGHTCFPRTPCENRGCEWRVNDARYLNCSFAVAAEGPHTHLELSQILGVSPQAVQQMEARALRKLKTRHPAVKDDHSHALQQLRRPVRKGDARPPSGPAEPRPNEAPRLQVVRGGKLA